MALSEDDERRVEAEVRADDRRTAPHPNQEKEDRIGLEISLLPEEERAFVPTALLRFLVAERRGEPLPEPASSTGLPPKPSAASPGPCAPPR